jgi:hypothetical protein
VTYVFGDNPRAAKRAIAVARTLLTGPDRLGGQMAPRNGTNLGTFQTLAGWWLHINAQAGDYLTLITSGSTITAAPLFRSIIEHTFSMIWLADTGEDAMTAISAYGWQQADKMLKSMTDNGWDVSGIQLPTKPATPADQDSPEGKRYNKLFGEFSTFVNMLTAFSTPADSSKDRYDVYRYLTTHSHATAQTAEAYIRQHDDGSVSFQTRAPDTGHADTVWLAVCLIETGLVISPLLKGDPLRPLLNKAIQSLGLPRVQLMPTRTKPLP